MTRTSVELSEVGARMAELTPLIRAGEVITLCEAQHPVAEIRPLEKLPSGRRPFGLAKGTFEVPESFALADSEVEMLFFRVEA